LKMWQSGDVQIFRGTKEQIIVTFIRTLRID